MRRRRYDTLIGNFGKDTSAVGIAIGVNRVLSALMRQKKTIVTPKTDALMVMGADFAASYALAQKLRGAGYCVENFYGDTQSALAAAKARGVAAADSPDGKWGGNHVCGRNSSAA